jgi:gluconolactonase
MKPVINIAQAEILYEGSITEPRLNHPEGICVDSEGNIWCGGETGEIYKLAKDGSELQLIATTGGFVLGLAFDDKGYLYACDNKHAAVFRLDPRTKELQKFAAGGNGQKMNIPNYPVVDVQRNVLYVSDSHDFKNEGPGIWRFDLSTGEGELWYKQNLRFANGMALSEDGHTLYVAETFAKRITKITILEDGAAGEAGIFVNDIGGLPDGLALDREGDLYISCYEPSRIYRYLCAAGELQLLIDDPEAHTLCHPTNMAFNGTHLYTSNLGRWHITRILNDREGLPLPAGGI